jgi:hypothetical protein
MCRLYGKAARIVAGTRHSRINSTKSPASGTDRLVSQVEGVREIVCA